MSNPEGIRFAPQKGKRNERKRHDGPEFLAKAVQEWIAVVGSKTAYIERGSPWENGYIESFNARLRDELLNGKIPIQLGVVSRSRPTNRREVWCHHALARRGTNESGNQASIGPVA